MVASDQRLTIVAGDLIQSSQQPRRLGYTRELQVIFQHFKLLRHIKGLIALGVLDVKQRYLLRRDPAKDLFQLPNVWVHRVIETNLAFARALLRRLEEAVQASKESMAEMLPDDLRFLAGIQRIQYVLVYPEEHDIVIAGPGEGWKVDEEGNVVGVTTGRPVLRLEDLLIAFRTADTARRGGISCSIDPTPEGRQRLEALSAKRSGSGAPPLAAMKKALGPQQITLTGVPTESHLARVLVSSDFHMKRLGMNLDPSPVKGLPSFIDMLKRDNSSHEHPTPRWWMACDYEPLGRSEDGLAFELRGRGVKCLAEDEVVDAEGKIKASGAANSVAQKWADLMTEHYDELCVKEPAFGDLRNVMDMCVVAALIVKEQLLAKADCKLPTLLGTTSKLGVAAMGAPKTVDSLCSQVKRGDEVIVMSGGVLTLGAVRSPFEHVCHVSFDSGTKSQSLRCR